MRLAGDNDLSIYSEAIRSVLENGIHIQELDVGFSDALLELEMINNPDYPYTPATFHAVPTMESTHALWRPDNRIFGAINDGVLIGAVATSREDKIVELDFGSLLREYRGRGIGKAMASAAIFAWAKSGIRIFATGGASVNDASLGTVRSLGFSVEEKWRSYQIIN